jgi:hypothetical protein
MKVCGEVEVHIHVFLTLALDGGELSAQSPATLLPGKVTRYPMDNKLGGPHSQYG